MNNKNTIKIMAIAGLFAIMAIPVSSVFASPPEFGTLLYEGEIARTVVPPSPIALGLDDYYIMTNGINGQLGIIAVAPGDIDYHGGQWIQNEVTFNVEPYFVGSEQDVLDAEAAGDVTINRNVAAFLCPVLPLN